jgi:chaperonin GroEL
VLAQAIVREGAKAVAAGMNPMDLKRGIDIAVEAVVEGHREALQEGHLQRRSPRSAPSPPTATSEIGKMIAEAMQKVGNEGVITVEEAKSARDRTRRRRGHAVRPRLPLAPTSSPTPRR